MVSYPAWFLDEQLMKQFFEAGGGAPSRDSEMRNAVGRFLKSHPNDDSTEIGFLTVEAPLGAERSRWMLRPISTDYLPLILQADKETVAVDPKTLATQKIDLEKISQEQFLDMALTKVFIQVR